MQPSDTLVTPETIRCLEQRLTIMKRIQRDQMKLAHLVDAPQAGPSVTTHRAQLTTATPRPSIFPRLGVCATSGAALSGSKGGPHPAAVNHRERPPFTRKPSTHAAAVAPGSRRRTANPRWASTPASSSWAPPRVVRPGFMMKEWEEEERFELDMEKQRWEEKSRGIYSKLTD